MKIEEMLRQYPYLAGYIKEEHEKINFYTELLNNIKKNTEHIGIQAQTISDMPRGGGLSDKTFKQAYENIKAYEEYKQSIRECDEKIQEYIKRMRWVDKALNTLTDKERELIKLRFFEQLSLQKIDKKLKWISLAVISDKVTEILTKIKKIV